MPTDISVGDRVLVAHRFVRQLSATPAVGPGEVESTVMVHSGEITTQTIVGIFLAVACIAAMFIGARNMYSKRPRHTTGEGRSMPGIPILARPTTGYTRARRAGGSAANHWPYAVPPHNEQLPSYPAAQPLAGLPPAYFPGDSVFLSHDTGPP